MKRLGLIAASSVAALAATFAIAQPQPIPQAGSDREAPRQERSDSREQRQEDRRQQRTERMEARMNERLDKLRTDMKLKPEQAPLFERVEALIKKSGEDRRTRSSAMREQRETLRDADIMERLEVMATRQNERAARTKEMADAVRPLWVTLSDEQKTVVRRAMREAMAEGRGRMERMHDRWDERRGGRDRDDDDGRDRGHRRHDHDGDRDRDRRG